MLTLLYVKLTPFNFHHYTELQKGYQALKSRIDTRKNALQSVLKAGEKISETDEAWLDAGANLVDEDIVLENLKGVADLAEAIELLPEHLQKAAKAMIVAGLPPSVCHSVNHQMH